MAELFTEYQLTKWSRLVRLRDEGVCLVCGGSFNIWRLQVHHIRPKSLYPELATQLSNGVTLCAGCHQGPVHRQNTFIDAEPNNPAPGWKIFLPMFTYHTRLAKQRHFAEKYQATI